jgi:hypothetical protein
MTSSPLTDYPVQPIPFTHVRIDDGFWQPRLRTNRRVTIPYDFQTCEETGRIDNFAKAAGWLDGEFEGIRFNDSDVFKVIEGAAYALSRHPDPALDAYLDDLIAKIAAAQEDDGYLFTTRTIDPDNPARDAGEMRWSSLRGSHELYNLGHLYEAAVAHYRATGKRALLDVALRSADLVADLFGPDKLRDVPGHEEIEIGLVKLYRVTGEGRYLDLARFFVEERGRAHGHRRELYGPYAQDHAPVVEQDAAVGHAVRAGYLYAGVADVAALTGDADLLDAIDRIWEDVVARKLYITGGIGARHEGEAFGAPYELPNATAYNETCAAIANVLWNHRLFLLHGDAQYLDVLERTLYNGFLAGVGFSGRAFFYPNPLAADGETAFNKGAATRQPWFGCSCCPTNVVRLLPSLPGYVYARQAGRVYVNLYIAGEATLAVNDTEVRLTQATRYPWDGDVAITVTPARPRAFELRLRVPGWARGRPVPSDLYRYSDPTAPPVTLAVNGAPVPLELAQGFAVISRTWRPGDSVTLHLPMPVRRVLSHPQVTENAGRVALERGPLVYCAEGVDHAVSVFDLVVPAAAELVVQREPELLPGVTVVRGPALADGAPVELTAIPYYAWSHRGVGEMAVWLRREAP